MSSHYHQIRESLADSKGAPGMRAPSLSRSNFFHFHTYPVNVAGTRNVKPPTKYMKPWYQLRVAEYTLLKTKFPTTTLNKLMSDTIENTDPEINPIYI